jgi:GntR family transcriptional regulator
MDEPRKYREIAAALQRQIEDGELSPGEKLPSDAELEDAYGASRNTVREAVKFLVSRGVLEKQGNRGTFVPDKIDPFSTVVSINAGFGGFEGADYASDVRSRNRKTTLTTPKVEIQEASGDIATDLSLALGEEVVIRHQERSIDGRLWSMQTTYYPMKFVDDGAKRLLQVKDIPEGTRSYLDSELGIKEIGSHDTMRVRAPNVGEAIAFGIPDDGRIAVFETRQIGVDASRAPVRITISIYPADRNQFSMETGALADDPALEQSG